MTDYKHIDEMTIMDDVVVYTITDGGFSFDFSGFVDVFNVIKEIYKYCVVGS